jgi:hypothetical protein
MESTKLRLFDMTLSIIYITYALLYLDLDYISNVLFSYRIDVWHYLDLYYGINYVLI